MNFLEGTGMVFLIILAIMLVLSAIVFVSSTIETMNKVERLENASYTYVKQSDRTSMYASIDYLRDEVRRLEEDNRKNILLIEALSARINALPKGKK